MVNESRIRPQMLVVCSTNEPCGMVDHVEGRSLKLARDASGQAHFIPLGWIERVDDKVHLGRSADEVMRHWTALPPPGDA